LLTLNTPKKYGQQYICIWHCHFCCWRCALSPVYINFRVKTYLVAKFGYLQFRVFASLSYGPTHALFYLSFCTSSQVHIIPLPLKMKSLRYFEFILKLMRPYMPLSFRHPPPPQKKKCHCWPLALKSDIKLRVKGSFCPPTYSILLSALPLFLSFRFTYCCNWASLATNASCFCLPCNTATVLYSYYLFMNMHFFTDLIAVKCEIFLTNIAFPVVHQVSHPVNVSSKLMQNVKIHI